MDGVGPEMYQWAEDLWGLPRSLTGEGVRQTLRYLQEIVPEIHLHEVPSGSPALDWFVPEEWTVRDAFIEDMQGNRIVDWKENNLHVVGYSRPIDEVVPLSVLSEHLHSLPDMPTAVPYVTSYYDLTWGFCLADTVRREMLDDRYHVVIDSSLEPGHLTYADLLIPGESSDEVLFSTYVCHPSMASNELSGPVVLTALARWIAQIPDRWYSYRFLFAPETIGSLVYLEQHANHLMRSVRAGWVVSCVGDDGDYSHVPSRLSGTLADRILAAEILKEAPRTRTYSWRDRGSDERQWCAPGIDLPVCTFTRSKFGTYPEYHTSLDDLDYISAVGLEGSLGLLQRCVARLEDRPRFMVTVLGEPQMSRRGLYPTLSKRDNISDPIANGAARPFSTRQLMTVLSMCDGDHDSREIADVAGIDEPLAEEMLALLLRANLVARDPGRRDTPDDTTTQGGSSGTALRRSSAT